MKKVLICEIILCAVLFVGCDDIFETDISESTIEIITPSDNENVAGTDVLFWWGYLDGSDSYEFQIANPNFESVMSLLLDTVLPSNRINISMDPGVYEWRIRACNSAYSTEYFLRSLVISGK